MPKLLDATEVVEKLSKIDSLWSEVFTVREMNHFIICQPPELQAKIDKVKSLLVEDSASRTNDNQTWCIVSKSHRPSVILKRVGNEFLIFIEYAGKRALWLEGVECKKHAILHIHSLMTYLLAIFS